MASAAASAFAIREVKVVAAGGALPRRRDALRRDTGLGEAGAHGSFQIQGIGANFIPDTLDRSIYDQVIRVRDEDAFTAGRELVRTEGVLVGISSGAALWAAAQLARQPEYAGKTIVVILPDSGDRYLSSPMFAE